jgi:hypothetical protein
MPDLEPDYTWLLVALLVVGIVLAVLAGRALT